MRVVLKHVKTPEEEQVVLECMEKTKDFCEIEQYALSVGDKVTVSGKDKALLNIRKEDILYMESVGELVFAYTKRDVYEMKMRLYEIEEEFQDHHFIRCSKSMIINLNQVDSVRPAINGRFLAKMANEEEVMISRQYAKSVKKAILEEL